MEESEHLCLEAEDLEPLAEPVLEAVRTGGVADVHAAGVPETEVAPREEPPRPLGAAEDAAMNLWAVGCGLAIGVATVVVVLVLHGIGIL